MDLRVVLALHSGASRLGLLLSQSFGRYEGEGAGRECRERGDKYVVSS